MGKGGWTDVDGIITMPSVMGKIGPLGRVLGPRGLMPNPKTGTVTMGVAKAVNEVKAGKIDFKVDRYGIIHAGIGKASFEADKIRENAEELIKTLIRMKPTAAKGMKKSRATGGRQESRRKQEKTKIDKGKNERAGKRREDKRSE